MKLDFSSPKKGEAATATTTTSPPNAPLATPINAEDRDTLNRSPSVNVIVQNTTSESSGTNHQSPSSVSGSSQSQKGMVKSSNKKLKGNSRRNRIVTFDEHQLNQSGSFSSIPIQDLLILAQQQVNSFKSPKKSAPSCSSTSQPSSPLQPISQPPPQSLPHPRQISSVTAVTIPNDIVSSVFTTITTSSVVTMTTAGVSSLQQQDVGGAVSSSSNSSSNSHQGLLVTMGHICTNASTMTTVNHVTTTPAVTTTGISITTTTPSTINTTNPTRSSLFQNNFFFTLYVYNTF